MSNPDVGSSVKPKRVNITVSRLVIPEHLPITLMPSRTRSCTSGTSQRGFYGTFTNFDLQNLQFGELDDDDFSNTYCLGELCDHKHATEERPEEVRWLESNFEMFRGFLAQNQYTRVDCFKGMSNYLSSEIMKSDISLYIEKFAPFRICTH